MFGKVTDASGGVLPGVTVTLSSPALLEPRVALTGATGTYEFSGLPIGTYAVRFELTGFGTVVRDALQLPSGFNAQVNGELSVGGLQENVVVTGVNPIVDIRSTTQGTRFNTEELQAIPSARDVFQVLTQTPGISSDRQNVGGTHNGQQTGMFSRGAGNGQARWLGGPIKKGRAWFWGTYGMQNVRRGVLNYYQPTAECAPVAANPLGYSFSDVIGCLNINKQDVPALGGKVNLRPVAGNLFTVATFFGQRVETIRGADDLHPTFETTNKMDYMRQSDSAYPMGPRFWNQGIWDPSWKFGPDLQVRRGRSGAVSRAPTGDEIA